MSDLYENLKVTILPHSEMEAEADIPAAVIEKNWPKALKKLGETTSLPGFRPGKIPEKTLIEKLGELAILEEAANIVFPEIVFSIFSKHIAGAIGRPYISITKIARGEPLHFKIKTAILPEVKLPDYASIANTENKKKPEEITIEEAEITKVLDEMHAAIADREKKEVKDLPLDDAFAKKIGNFNDLADLKVKIKENITQEKTVRSAEKKRITLLDAILAGTTVDLPEILIASEEDRMFSRFSDDIARMGLKPDDYFKHLGKTREDMKKEWRPQAEKNAKLDLILASIAKQEKIMPEKEAIDAEVKHLLSHYKDANQESVRGYVTMILTHQKVFAFLESQK